mmetsp:Transcript_55156/g.110758  ORF Transcript_55156/g.110758 Transcript_55156/m.110758 type:complete len:303 (-) Transcript_55156:1052-1960(-)
MLQLTPIRPIPHLLFAQDPKANELGSTVALVLLSKRGDQAKVTITPYLQKCIYVVKGPAHVLANLGDGARRCEGDREDRLEFRHRVVALLARHSLHVVPVLLYKRQRAPEFGQQRYLELAVPALQVAIVVVALDHVLEDGWAVLKVRVTTELDSHLVKREGLASPPHFALGVPVPALTAHRLQAFVLSGVGDHELDLILAAPPHVGRKFGVASWRPFAAIVFCNGREMKAVRRSLLVGWSVVVAQDVLEAWHFSRLCPPFHEFHETFCLSDDMLVAEVARKNCVSHRRVHVDEERGSVSRVG